MKAYLVNTLRDWIKEQGAEESVISFFPKVDRKDIEEWLK